MLNDPRKFYNIEKKTLYATLVTIGLVISVLANVGVIRALYKANDDYDHYRETLLTAWYTVNGSWTYALEQHKAIENLTVMILVYQMHFLKHNITPPAFEEVFQEWTMKYLWEHYPPNSEGYKIYGP